jgi:hypothetical protein
MDEQFLQITRADADAAQADFLRAVAADEPIERIMELARSCASVVHGYAQQRIEVLPGQERR